MPQTHQSPGSPDASPQPLGGEVTVKVRDVVRHHVYQLSGSEPMLRVPYDLFNPVGPVQLRGDLIQYLQAGEVRTGNTAPGTLRESHPGERVLVQPPSPKGESEWWLCEVIEVDGVAAD